MPTDPKAFNDRIKDIVKDEDRAIRGSVLKNRDDFADFKQRALDKVKNVPLVGKYAKSMKKSVDAEEAGIKAGRAANYAGAGDEGTIKAIKIGRLGGQAGAEAGETVKKLASEHGGKMAVATAAGLGALGLVKALRRKKSKPKQIESKEQRKEITA